MARVALMRFVVPTAILASLASCGQAAAPSGDDAAAPADDGAAALELQAAEFAYSPNELTVKVGQTATVFFTNGGTMNHSLEIELPEDAGGEVELEAEVPATGSSELAFTAPTTAGSYEYYCPVADHKDRGMTGTLVVTP